MEPLLKCMVHAAGNMTRTLGDKNLKQGRIWYTDCAGKEGHVSGRPCWLTWTDQCGNFSGGLDGSSTSRLERTSGSGLDCGFVLARLWTLAVAKQAKQVLASVVIAIINTSFIGDDDDERRTQLCRDSRGAPLGLSSPSPQHGSKLTKFLQNFSIATSPSPWCTLLPTARARPPTRPGPPHNVRVKIMLLTM